MAYGLMAPEALIYLHGGPGAPIEIQLFGEAGWRTVYAPDRFALFSGCDAASAFDRLADDIRARSNGRKIHLIGFSMGGFAALQLARRLGPLVARIDLIAAAAPLQCGAFLDQMAGKPLFTIAQRKPEWLGLVLAIQSFVTKYFPQIAYKMLFANSFGDDRLLVRDPAFKARTIAILQHCYANGAGGLARELKHYVMPWSDILPSISAPVTLWQGDADNWVPPAMAEFLSRAMKNATLVRIEGASHYSTLCHALKHILR